MPYKGRQKKRSYASARRAAWRGANLENAKAYAKTYNAVYYAAHREEIKARSAAWRAAHQEKEKARSAVYQAEHPEVGRTANARRQARKKALPATLTRAEWQAIQAAYLHRCAYCGRKQNRLTQDHVIPLSKGGGTTRENIVPACKSCNFKKHTGLPPKPTQLVLL